MCGGYNNRGGKPDGPFSLSELRAQVKTIAHGGRAQQICRERKVHNVFDGHRDEPRWPAPKSVEVHCLNETERSKDCVHANGGKWCIGPAFGISDYENRACHQNREEVQKLQPGGEFLVLQTQHDTGDEILQEAQYAPAGQDS